jgi:hypothetical protein
VCDGAASQELRLQIRENLQVRCAVVLCFDLSWFLRWVFVVIRRSTIHRAIRCTTGVTHHCRRAPSRCACSPTTRNQLRVLARSLAVVDSIPILANAAFVCVCVCVLFVYVCLWVCLQTDIDTPEGQMCNEMLENNAVLFVHRLRSLLTIRRHQECKRLYLELTCGLFCQPCESNKSPTKMLRMCDKYCQVGFG